MKIIKCYMKLKKKKKKKKKKTLFNFGQIFIFMEIAGMKHLGYFICFFTPLCSNIRKLPGIIDFLQVMFAVTRSIIEKHVRMYFLRNMYHLTT